MDMLGHMVEDCCIKLGADTDLLDLLCGFNHRVIRYDLPLFGM